MISPHKRVAHMTTWRGTVQGSIEVFGTRVLAASGVPARG